MTSLSILHKYPLICEKYVNLTPFMFGGSNIRKSKYTYSNRFVIRETLANYQYPDEIISFMLKETKIYENLYTLIKYYQADALSFLQHKTNKSMCYHIYNEIYNVYLFHNDIKGLFKRAKMDRLKQYEVRRVILLCEYIFVNRYITKEEKTETMTLDDFLENQDIKKLKLDNVHLLHTLSDKQIIKVKHDIMSFNKTLCIKDTNSTLYYYFENQIVGMLRENWDRTLFELIYKIFNDYCALKHNRNEDCIKYFRRKMRFVLDTKYMQNIDYHDLKYIGEHLKLKRKHYKIIAKKGMDPEEVLHYYKKYREIDVLLYFAERKYHMKIFLVISRLGIDTEITRRIRNNYENKVPLIFSHKSVGINRVNEVSKKQKSHPYFFYL